MLFVSGEFIFHTQIELECIAYGVETSVSDGGYIDLAVLVLEAYGSFDSGITELLVVNCGYVEDGS